ncbi:hypothetical protein EDD86DRAFT_246845 [Gorgonomyces haynaldii]|nr:hypothetical protein EDD86DRAFT_246845 [Gorgonomyces haynaldii]
MEHMATVTLTVISIVSNILVMVSSRERIVSSLLGNGKSKYGTLGQISCIVSGASYISSKYDLYPLASRTAAQVFAFLGYLAVSHFWILMLEGFCNTTRETTLRLRVFFGFWIVVLSGPIFCYSWLDDPAIREIGLLVQPLLGLLVSMLGIVVAGAVSHQLLTHSRNARDATAEEAQKQLQQKIGIQIRSCKRWWFLYTLVVFLQLCAALVQEALVLEILDWKSNLEGVPVGLVGIALAVFLVLFNNLMHLFTNTHKLLSVAHKDMMPTKEEQTEGGSAEVVSPK